jgi:uncharacterized membrane protein
MVLTSTFRWLNDSWLGHLGRETTWLFAGAQAVHFVALCFLFGAILVMDLRLLGFARAIPIRAAVKLAPVALGAFGCLALSGFVFFCTHPDMYTPNWGFWAKMGAISLAGLNALWFALREHRKVLALADDGDTDTETKVVAGLSIALWLVVLCLGRLLPYLNPGQY